jgi:hypothetical protein
MERVNFLMEDTGQRVGCLLNPESVTVSRLAGIRPRHPFGGSLVGATLSDEPLFFTGGGVTEINLELLFDVSIAGSTIRSDDVRDLTGPLRDLAENRGRDARVHFAGPPLVTFIWGKTWNIPGVVTAIAERLESFTANGVPRRSWVRLRFVRVDGRERRRPTRATVSLNHAARGLLDAPVAEADELLATHTVIGESSSTGSGERLDEVAERYYGNAELWRLIAIANGIDNPHEIAAGTRLRIPFVASARETP